MNTSNDVEYRRQALDLSCDLSQIKVDPEFQNSLLLHFISKNEESFALKIAKRPDLAAFINITDQFCGHSALLLAIKRGFKELATFLIENGADVSLVDAYGNNALHYACYLRDDALLRALCSSDSYKSNKKKCLEQRENRDHLTPVDLYLFETHAFYPNGLDTHRNMFNYRAPPYNNFHRPEVTLEWLNCFECDEPSEAMLKFANKNYNAYFRNRPYIQRVPCTETGGYKINAPTDTQVEQLKRDNAKYLTAQYYKDHCKAIRVQAIAKLSLSTERYLRHLEAAVEKPNSVALATLETKKERVRSLLSTLTDSSQPESARIGKFQTDLNDANDVLAKHRDTGWMAFFARALLVLTGVRFFYSAGPVRFWRSHGEQFARDCEQLFKSPSAIRV